MVEMVQAKQMVEAGGGVLLWQKKDWGPEEQSLLPYAIRLLGQSGAEQVEKTECFVPIMFSVDYLFDCVAQNKILLNLLKYRLVQ